MISSFLPLLLLGVRVSSPLTVKEKTLIMILLLMATLRALGMNWVFIFYIALYFHNFRFFSGGIFMWIRTVGVSCVSKRLAGPRR